jgi:hypothetical protein
MKQAVTTFTSFTFRDWENYETSIRIIDIIIPIQAPVLKNDMDEEHDQFCRWLCWNFGFFDPNFCLCISKRNIIIVYFMLQLSGPLMMVLHFVDYTVRQRSLPS